MPWGQSLASKRPQTRRWHKDVPAPDDQLDSARHAQPVLPPQSSSGRDRHENESYELNDVVDDSGRGQLTTDESNIRFAPESSISTIRGINGKAAIYRGEADSLINAKTTSGQNRPEPVTSISAAGSRVGDTITAAVTIEDPYTIVDFFFGCLSIVFFLFDVGSDIFLAYKYYIEDHYIWFGLTVGFIVIPSITITGMSLTWYLVDSKIEERKELNGPCHWVARFIMLLLQLGPLLRYIDAIRFGWRSRRHRDNRAIRDKWYKEKLWEDTDSSLLRLIECFMESAPQLTLQLYIMSTVGVTGHLVLIIAQSVSCVTSLLSISWALTTYQRALRNSLDHKAKLTYPAMAVMFLWRLFTVGARVISFALFASQFHYWVFVVAGIHYVIMFIWILLQRTSFCPSCALEIVFNAVAAVISIFCFFNLIEGHTRLRYLFFYALVYLENCAMILAWYFQCTTTMTSQQWYVIPAMVAVLALFFVGIIFQLIYYLSCHPNNQAGHHSIRCCVSLRELCTGEGAGETKRESRTTVDCEAKV